MEKEALLYQRAGDEETICLVCVHRCRIKEGRRGICKARVNRGGILYCAGYGNVVACANDPVEKKPLFHFLPASQTLSIASAGCNFSCRFCQNYTISQSISNEMGGAKFISPDAIVALAKREGSSSISYTYTEPAVFLDLAFDTMREAAVNGLKNVFVTNGYLNAEVIDAIAPYLDAANVDLKSFREEFYRDYCKAHLLPVLEGIRRMKERGIWLEITTLLIPLTNDSDEEIAAIAGFIAEIDTNIPWHISRFFPRYQLCDLPPTPLGTMERAMHIGKEKELKFVYTGNISHATAENTFCPSCGELLIERAGYLVRGVLLDGSGSCPRCGALIAGCWR